MNNNLNIKNNYQQNSYRNWKKYENCSGCQRRFIPDNHKYCPFHARKARERRIKLQLEQRQQNVGQEQQRRNNQQNRQNNLQEQQNRQHIRQQLQQQQNQQRRQRNQNQRGKGKTQRQTQQNPGVERQSEEDVQNLEYLTIEEQLMDTENEEKDDDQEKFECPICFENFKIIDGMIVCFDFDNSECEASEKHGICIDCMRHHAKAAVEDVPLVEGGIGLKCVIPDCKNVLLMSEFGMYLEDDIYTALIKRMQHESIVTAEMSDLVTCPNCSRQFIVDVGTFYRCSCGRIQCRYCPRPYDDYHSNKTCEEIEMLENRNKIEQQITSKLSEAVIRICPKCKLQFMKERGCNKIKCRCGISVCYLCLVILPESGYDHFCECGGDKTIGQSCYQCGKKCSLQANTEVIDNEKINKIKADAGIFS